MLNDATAVAVVTGDDVVVVIVVACVGCCATCERVCRVVSVRLDLSRSLRALTQISLLRKWPRSRPDSRQSHCGLKSSRQLRIKVV